MSFCAIGKVPKKLKTSNGEIIQSCFDRPSLERIRASYNRKYPNNKITGRISQQNDGDLWEDIRIHLSDRCAKFGDGSPEAQEICWLDTEFIRGDYDLLQQFKPPIPDQPKQWLETKHFDKVLKPYELVYKDFAFTGAVPIDFKLVIEEFKKLDLCRMYHGQGLTSTGQPFLGRPVRQIGFIFNLDPHDQNGSHWVSMFLNLKAKKPWVGYFDSVGGALVPPQITELMDSLVKQAKSCLGIKLLKKINRVRFQYKNTECGVYASYFIYQGLRGKSFEDIIAHVLDDDAISQYRKLFFRPTKTYKGGYFRPPTKLP
jgi:hypothetical protein